MDALNRRRFWRLSAINVFSNLMVPLAGLSNVAFLGHLSDIRHLAGVALATILFNYLYWTFGFLRMGTTGLTAQAAGRGDEDEVLVVGVRNWLVALALGLAIVLLQSPLREAGFALLSATSEVKASGRAFYDALIWGAPATLINFVLLGWFLGREQSGRVLVLSVVVNFANIALDYLFIVRWGWQSTGAGAATAISQYLMFAIGMLLAVGEIDPVRLRRVAGRLLDPTALRAVFVLNRDLLIRTFALVSVFSAFINLGSGMGTIVLVTNAVLMQVVTFGAYFVDGIAFATESLAGYFKGEGKGGQLRSLVWLAGTVSLATGLVFAALTAILPGQIFGLLTDRPEVTAQIGQYVPWLIPVLGFGSIAWMLDGYFLGLTESRVLRNAALVAALAGFVPVAFFAWQQQNPQLLWLALTLFTAARVASLAWLVPATFVSVAESSGDQKTA